MKKVKLIILSAVIGFSGKAQSNVNSVPTRTIFAYGGQFTKPFMQYVIKLTKKQNPKICFIATATGDNPNGILAWYTVCEDLPMRPYVQKTYVASYTLCLPPRYDRE